MKNIYIPTISVEVFDKTMDELYTINENGKKVLSKEKLEDIYCLFKDKNPLAVGVTLSFSEVLDHKELAAFNTATLITLAILNNQLKENFNLSKNN